MAPRARQNPTHAADAVRDQEWLYERRLAADARWALEQGGRHFEERSAVHESLRRITRRLDELGIPHAVAGAMAMFSHGYRRFTEDVAILVAPEGLEAIHDHLNGLGYVPPFPGSRNLRETESGVRIEFLVSGQYPGDGKPEAVAFPEPAQAAVERDGIKYVNLESLIELKLASGIGSPGRLKDLADVQELIKALRLPRDIAGRLNAYVAGKYDELWAGAQGEAGD